jgi:Family of unknown function (DUF6401)
MSVDLSEITLRLAGEAGQAGLARSADSDGMRASVDQHAAEIRDALDDRLSTSTLLSYARGFVEAAVARGWWPRHGLDRLDWLDWPDWPDWESLRLAAVCRLFIEAQGLGLTPAA